MNALVTIAGIMGIIVLAAYVLVTGVGGIIDILYNSSIPLPRSFRDYVRSKKIEDTVALLRAMSLLSSTGLQQQAALYRALPSSTGRSLYESDVRDVIKRHHQKGSFIVGRIRDKPFDYFVDLMGASTDHRIAERLGRGLASFIKDEMASLTHQTPVIPQKIVTPKNGSPFIGLATARTLDVPCALFRGNESPKTAQPNDDTAYFDGQIVPGEHIVLVDDSTTGGRMLIELRQGYVEWERP